VPSSIHAVGDCGGNGVPNALNVGLRYGLKYNLRGDLVELFEDCFKQLHKARLLKFPSLMHCPLPCGICTSSTRSSRLGSAMRSSPSRCDRSRRSRDTESCGRLLSSELVAAVE
jgi:hypothetical protein